MKLLLVCLLWLVAERNIQQPSGTDRATLILYREKEFYVRRGQGLAFTINNKDRVRLSANRYVEIQVTPGRTKLQFGNDYFAQGKTIWLTTQPGQTYYVKIAIDVDFMKSTLLMAPVAGAEARQELRRMKPELTPSPDQPD